MNQYHIYQAIGRGKNSTVYKGRKKKTIEYFAVKSVDKAQKNKVLQEVRILHVLDHPNVLKFYSWYETTAHLWLILEYCVGGDLMAILKQDGKLPEDSVRDLACDLVKALQFLHSKGIIYCDLKPSNILLDENGHTKLCDFGLARKLSDISRTPFAQLPQAKRGTPFYMAPELFQDGGVHSYASDIWALGCVLFECYTGKPPFVGRELTQLIRSIISDPTPILPGSPSRPFANLINSLLIKDPAERIQWAEICSHVFWRSQLDQLALPYQPAFMEMLERSSRPCLSVHNGEKPHHSKTSNKIREKAAKGSLKDENATHETPTENASSGQKVQVKIYGRGNDKNKDNLSTRGVNLLRLSTVANKNLQREKEKQNYRLPLPKSSDNGAEVEIENTDMELDFNDNTEDEAPDEYDASGNTNFASESDSTSLNQLDEGTKDIDSSNTSHSDASHETNTPVHIDSSPRNLEASTEHVEDTSTAPGSSPQLKPTGEKNASYLLDCGGSELAVDISEVLWHPSDISARPVMPSRKSAQGSDSFPSLPFDAVPACDFIKMTKEELELLNNRISNIIQGNTAIVEKQNVIKYLEILSSNADAANILTNGPLMLVLVKVFRQSKAAALRAQLASVVGLLIRHSTFIGDDLAKSGILVSLTDGLRDKQEKVRRFSMAALGELLFYISTQNEQDMVGNPPESPSNDMRPSRGWQVSNPLISLVCSVLRNGEDYITQLLALRTIENISSQGGYWTTRFTGQDVMRNLCYIFKATGKQESHRLTAGSCLARLVRHNPPSILRVMEQISVKEIVSGLKGSSREQQICLNLLNTAMVGSQTSSSIGKYLHPMTEDKNLVPYLVSILEQGSEILKGKALIFVALICRHGRRWLSLFFCNTRLLSSVDRLLKEKDHYVHRCLGVFANVVSTSIPSLLESIICDIEQSMSVKRREPYPGLSNRSIPKSHIHLFPVILHLLESSLFKYKVGNDRVLQQLATLLKLAVTPFEGRDEFHITLVKVLESISEEPSLVLKCSDTLIKHILPGICAIYKGNKDGNSRFLCLKILFDSMITLVNEPSDNGQETIELKNICTSHFLPLYPSLIEDEDPIPVYAQKLLVILMEYNYIKVPDILNLKMVSQCFESLLDDFSSANVNTALLCLALASSHELETKTLSQLKAVRKIGNLLEFVCTSEMNDFIEPSLNLCKTFLLRSLGGNNNSDHHHHHHQHESIKDVSDFGYNVGVLLDLCNCSVNNIAALASECLILIFKASPKEATTCLLTNLSKVSAIIDPRNHGISNLLIERTLDTLGYSIRIYISYAMIISIPIHEIMKIESFVSEHKRCGVGSIANAAAIVGMELQRLPPSI